MTDTATRRLPSLRAELLVSFAVLVLCALVVAVAGIMVIAERAPSAIATGLIVATVVAVVAIALGIGAWLLRRVVLHPLREMVAAAEAIADGALDRRVPPGPTLEFATLAASVNHMTGRLLEGRAELARVEKLASVGRLAAGIAHEIGNPLGAINAYAHLLRSRLDPERAGGAEALDGLERESARIDRIVRGLLDYARPRRQMHAPVDLNDIVLEATRLLGEQGVLRGIRLSVTLDQARPSVLGERHELEQALVNLLLNAVDATGSRGDLQVTTQRVPVLHDSRGAHDEAPLDAGPLATPRVEAWIARQPELEEAALLIVADSGPGVAAHEADRIFEPFYTTKQPGKGTGLGLAFVARVVEDLRGTVWVQTSSLGGAAFHVLLPQLAPATAPEP